MNESPWEKFPHIWPTRASFFNYLRGGFRKGIWSRHPVKLEYLQQNRVKVPLGKKTKKNPEGMVWGCKCEVCGNLFRQTECEVDHIDPAGKLQSVDDFVTFITKLCFIDFDDIRIVDKGCHRIISYADANGISFEQARTEKMVIEKCKSPVDKQKKELLEYGYSEADVSNATKRKQCWREVMHDNRNKTT